MTLDNTGNAL